MLKMWIQPVAALLICLLLAPAALAQSDPDIPALPELQREMVDPVWQVFEPAFTPYVCPFHAEAPAYDPEEFRCGYVLVPEDRTNANSRLIKLSVLKIRSTAANPERRAVIRLTGGPGGPSLSAGRIRAYQSANTQKYRESADLIFFDQRGIGYSEAAFCRAVPRNFQFGVSTTQGGPLLIEAFRKCLNEARAQGISVDAYSTWQNALDVRDIRRALGYAQWTLFGVSYGTQLGQAVIQVDEAGTRAAILDSVVPAAPLEQGGWGAVAYGFRSSLTALSEMCAQDQACARDIGSFADRFIAAFEAYDQDPLTLDGLDHGRFLNGRLVMDGDLAGGAVFQALYSHRLYADFPSLLRALETRDGTAIKAYVDVLGRRIDHSAGNGLELVANCRGPALLTDQQTAEMRATEPQLSKWIDSVSWTRTCRGAYKIAPDPAVQTLVTDVPILVAAGTVDPITPPSYGQAILPGLAHAQYVEFPYTGHGALLSHSAGCGGALWVAFVADPAAALDASCIAEIEAPQFLTRRLETKAPYALARDLQAGQYPWLPLGLAGLLLTSLFVFPLGWAARRIQASPVQDLAHARPIAWVGALFSLGGFGWAVRQILATATSHPMALPLGVLPAAGWSVWLAFIGTGLTGFAIYRAARAGSIGRHRIAASLGLGLVCLASFGILAFLLALGLGPF